MSEKGPRSEAGTEPGGTQAPDGAATAHKPVAAAHEPAAADLSAPADLSAASVEQLAHELRAQQLVAEQQQSELLLLQRELDASRAQYAELYDLAPVGFVTLSEAGLILAANRTLASLLGVDHGALDGQPLSRFILPEDQDEYSRHRQALFETGAPQVCELRLLRSGADPFWARLQSTAATDADGARLCRAVVSNISEVRRTQQEAERRQRFIDAILAHAPVGFAVNTIDDGVAHFVSGRFEEIYGLAPGTVRSVDDFFDAAYPDPAYREPLKARVLADMASGEPARMHWEDLLVTTASGERRVVIASNIPLPEQNLMISAVQDVTERHRAVDALRASEQQLSQALSMARAGHWAYDVAKDTFTFNDNFYGMFRTTAAEVGGYTMSAADYARRFCHPDDAPLVAQETQAALQAVEPTFSRELEHRVVFPDGKVGHIAVRFFIQKDEQGRTVRTYGVNQDISERRRMEEALRTSEARFKAVFENASDGLVLTDLTTNRFAMANQALCAMLGYSREEIVELGPDDIHPEPARRQLADVFSGMTRGVPPGSHDLPVIRKDGTIFTADVRGGRVLLDGHPFAVGSFRDMTEVRRLQASLSQSDRLASMGMLAAGVAHEINNPLSYVLFNVESLAQELPRLARAVARCGGALREHVSEAEIAAHGEDVAALLSPATLEDAADRAREALEGATRIKEISRSLGTFSRVERVECGTVDLNAAIEHAATMAHNEIKYRARLVKDLSPVPAVWASAGKLAQVFLNLLINAAHAIGETDPEHNAVTVRSWAEGHAVFAEVSDTGRGILPEHLERVFEPFYTTKKVGEGSGLGLAICRTIIGGFGGTMRVESQLGEGTRFIVRLPLPPEAPATREARGASTAPRAPSVRGRILVIDDEAPIRRVMTRLLGKVHEVVTAASGAAGQALLERDRAFDLILCDLMMPELSGMDLHEWLAERDAALAQQVVFVTGGAFTPRASEYVARAGNLRIEKPFDASNLARLVGELVAAAKSRQ